MRAHKERCFLAPLRPSPIRSGLKSEIKSNLIISGEEYFFAGPQARREVTKGSKEGSKRLSERVPRGCGGKRHKY